jgi:quercetin dioxygenase-like cupin family protein
MRLSFFILALMIATLQVGPSAAPVSGQTTPGPSPTPTPVRNILATAALPSVVDAPLHFKLLRLSLPAGQSTGFKGADGFLFQMSGALAVTGGGDSRTLRNGEAMFVGRGESATLKATGGEAVFLHFLLVPAADLEKAAEGKPAVLNELYRTPAPIPSLKAGPHEFTLTRVTFPPRMPSNVAHYRSGGALYYVLSGTGTRNLEGRTETHPAGTTLFEPYGLVHQWGNPTDTPLVILQANISPEGVPAVILGVPPAGSK